MGREGYPGIELVSKREWISDDCTEGRFTTINENPETDVVVNLNNRKEKESATLSYLYFRKKMGEILSPWMLKCPHSIFHWVPLFPYICLSPCSHTTPVSTSLVLKFKSCDTRLWDHLYVSFVSPLRQIQSQVVQDGFDLSFDQMTEICLVLSPKSWD